MSIDQTIREVLRRDHEEHKLPPDIVASRVTEIISSAKKPSNTTQKESST